ncbi:MAG: phosphate ABC transporter substrate-binding protein PstS family protein [Actinomycetes bacterium]
MKRSSLRRTAAPAAIALTLSLGLAACGGADAGSDTGSGKDLSGSISIDGSSTVAPLSTAAAELFQSENPNVRVTVGTSGTGGGFEKFCAGETDISDASRPIEPDEAKVCQEKGIDYSQLQIANDALTVVVNKENDFADCLTTEQLNKIWEPGSKVKSWKDVDPSFPDEPIELFGPGTDSGTFDYFTEEINGEEGASRTDYSPSEDDNVIVQGVSGSTGGMGYFGYTYYEQNTDKLKAVEIDGGDGCVAPGKKVAQTGEYKPLSRPLYIYPKTESMKKPHVKGFVEYYVDNAADIAEKAQYIPLNSEQESELKSNLEKLTSQTS